MGTRRQVIAGNWKMNTTLEDAVALARGVAKAAAATPNVETVVIPPACFLAPVLHALEGGAVGVGLRTRRITCAPTARITPYQSAHAPPPGPDGPQPRTHRTTHFGTSQTSRSFSELLGTSWNL